MVELLKFEKTYEIRDRVFYTKVEVVENQFGGYLVRLQYRQKDSQKIESTKFPIYDDSDENINMQKLEKKIMHYLGGLPVKSFGANKQKMDWRGH